MNCVFAQIVSQLKRCLEPPILNVLRLWQIHDIVVNGRLYLASAAKTQP